MGRWCEKALIVGNRTRNLLLRKHCTHHVVGSKSERKSIESLSPACYRTPRFNTSSQPNQQTLNTSLPNSKLSLFTSLVVSQKTKQHGALVITQCVLCMRKVCRACVRRVCMTFLHTPPPDNKSRMKKKMKWEREKEK